MKNIFICQCLPKKSNTTTISIFNLGILDIFRMVNTMGYLFIIAESEPPAGYLICKMFDPIEKRFNQKHRAEDYCDTIDSIGITFICISKNLQDRGYCKNRKYVSHKKRYADYRIRIPYIEFLESSSDERFRICLEILPEILSDIQRKVPTFEAKKFLADFHTVVNEYLNEVQKRTNKWTGIIEQDTNSRKQ